MGASRISDLVKLFSLDLVGFCIVDEESMVDVLCTVVVVNPVLDEIDQAFFEAKTFPVC